MVMMIHYSAGNMRKSVVDPITKVAPIHTMKGLVEDYGGRTEDVLLIGGELHDQRKPVRLPFRSYRVSSHFQTDCSFFLSFFLSTRIIIIQGSLFFTSREARDEFAAAVLYSVVHQESVQVLADAVAAHMLELNDGRMWMAAHWRRGDCEFHHLIRSATKVLDWLFFLFFSIFLSDIFEFRQLSDILSRLSHPFRLVWRILLKDSKMAESSYKRWLRIKLAKSRKSPLHVWTTRSITHHHRYQMTSECLLNQSSFKSDNWVIDTDLTHFIIKRWFLATDERDPKALKAARSQNAILISELLESTPELRRLVGWPLLFGDVLALVEQQIMARAAVFFGQARSSVVGGVVNIRGLRGMDPRTTLLDHL